MEGFKGLTNKFKKFQRHPIRTQVDVGYGKEYATVQHETQWFYHDPPQQWKYLEQPAREFKHAIQTEITRVTKQTHQLKKGLMAGGRLLLMESKKIVPVETGALKASGFVALRLGGQSTGMLR